MGIFTLKGSLRVSKQPELFPSPYHIGQLYTHPSSQMHSEDYNFQGCKWRREAHRLWCYLKESKLTLGEELFFMYCSWQTTNCSKYPGINSPDMFYLAHTLFWGSPPPRHFELAANISKLGHYTQESGFLVFFP